MATNAELVSVIRDLEKRVIALEEQLNNHMFPNRFSNGRLVGRIAGTYDPKTSVSTPGEDYSLKKDKGMDAELYHNAGHTSCGIGAFEPRRNITGAERKRLIGCYIPNEAVRDGGNPVEDNDE